MSIPITTEREVISTIQGQVIELTIDTDALVHIMGLMTDLYEDAITAILREYSTNGRDAHIEANVSRPVEVTLPEGGLGHSTLTVRDYGIGLDATGIAEIYSKYGASTKRGTNDQTGQLGLGCKSALTYTDQFTLTGVKDGQRCVVCISRNAEGAGTMTVVEETETDEPNGVEVVIPIRRDDTAKIAAKARTFFQYWETGTVLVNGEEPTRVDGLWLSDKLLVVENPDYGTAEPVVVMGSVPYPAAIPHSLPATHNLVCFVDIGSVEFTPAREALKDTPTTAATLARLGEDFKQAAEGAVQREIDKQTDRVSAIQTRDQWHRALGLDVDKATHKFKGEEVPRGFSLPVSPDPEPDPEFVLVHWNSSALNHHDMRRRLVTTSWPTALWVYGYDRVKFTAAQKKKLVHWCEQEERRPTTFVLLEDRPGIEKWLDSEQLVDWEKIAAVKLPREQRNHTTGEHRIPGSHDLWEDGDWKPGTPGDDINTKYPIFYAHKFEGSRFLAALAEVHDQFTLVSLPSNRIGKFQRLFPGAAPARNGVQEAFDAWAARVHTTTRQALALKAHDSDQFTTLARLDEAKVDDPKVKSAIRLASKDLTKAEERSTLFTRILGTSLTLPKCTAGKTLDPYPLLKGGGYYYRAHTPIDHTYLYMNAAYAARTKEDSQ